MALLDSEIQRIRYELGFATLTVNAEPYISFVSIFTQIIQKFLQAGALSSSATAVVSSGVLGPFDLTLTDPTGFSLGDRVFVDVDDFQESATIRHITGSTIGVYLKLDHSGIYPVGVDGGEGIVREILKNIRDVKKRLATTFGTGALKQVDEVGFYPTRDRTQFRNLYDQLMGWRAELSQVLSNGQQLNMWAQAQSGGQRLSVY